jgi:hypothetical protein
MYSDKLIAKKLLKQKLYDFSKFNPQFGRKIYKKVVNISIGNNKTENFQYNTKHIAFNEGENIKDRNEFMHSHKIKLIEEVHDDSDDDSDDDAGNDDNENETGQDNDSIS